MQFVNVFNPNPSFATVKVTSLTAGRVPYIGTGGLLTDSANLTFASDTLTVKNYLDVGGAVALNASPFSSAGAIAGFSRDVDNITGILISNINTGTNADQRMTMRDSGGNAWSFSLPGVGNAAAAILGMARATTAFIFNTGGTVRDIAIGTLGAKTFVLGTNNTARITILSGGNVGINTAVPTAQLHVTGTIEGTTTITAGTNVLAGYSLYSGTPSTASGLVYLYGRGSGAVLLGAQDIAGTQSFKLPNVAPGGESRPLISSVAGVWSWNDQPVLTTSTPAFNAITINAGATGVTKTTDDLLITTAANKTVVLSQVVYKDINLGAANFIAPSAGYPDKDEIVDEAGADTGIETFAFGVNEGISSNFEIQHDYKEGTDLTFHVHWEGITAPAGGTDNVQWRLAYTITRDGQTVNAVTTVDSPDAAITAQYQCVRSDFAAIAGATGGYDGGIIKIGDQFNFKLSRVAATADEYGGDALLLTAGVHYQIDTIGSRTISAK